MTSSRITEKRMEISGIPSCLQNHFDHVKNVFIGVFDKNKMKFLRKELQFRLKQAIV